MVRFSSTPNPRLPSGEEWLAVAIAVGVLGGLVLWPLLPQAQDTAPVPPSTPRSLETRAGEPEPGESISEDDTPQQDAARTFRVGLGRPLAPRVLPQRQSTPFRGLPQLPALVSPQSLHYPRTERPSTPDPVTVPPPALPNTEASSAPGGDSAPDPLTFEDVPPDHWAKPYIDGLSGRGIVQGFPDGTYRPDQSVTRAEVAAQLAQAFPQLPPVEAAVVFGDVPPDHWGRDLIDQAVAQGFLRGYPGDEFQPEVLIPRVQVLVALAAGLQMPIPARPEQVLSPLQDREEIPAWARRSVAAAIATQIANPDGQQLLPTRPATRAEVAAMIYQALVYLGEVPPITPDS